MQIQSFFQINTRLLMCLIIYVGFLQNIVMNNSVWMKYLHHIGSNVLRVSTLKEKRQVLLSMSTINQINPTYSRKQYHEYYTFPEYRT